MKPADFLAGLLKEQKLTSKSPEFSDLEARRGDVEKVLRAAFPDSSPSIRYGGSKAKDTMVRESYDLDLTCFFRNDDTKPGATLEDVYNSVRGCLTKKKFKVREKTSAVRVLGDDDVDFHVDVVPGRFTDRSESDAFLHRTSGNKDRLKTNLQTHVDHVRDSGLTDAICLVKLWRGRQGIDLRTFPLELLVLELLKDKVGKGLDEQLKHIWEELRDRVDEIKIEDPANPSGNDLGEIFGEKEREALAVQAAQALEAVENEKWEEIFPAQTLQKQTASSLVLGGTTHADKPRWPARQTRHQVSVVCRAHRKQGGGYSVANNGSRLLDGTSLEFRASTDVPAPFEIYWQVVNTGAHAESESGLRGKEFFSSRAIDGKTPSSQAHVTWEKSSYTGKHWIECFVVKQGELWAKSGPFYVNILNRKWRRRR